MYIHIEHSIYLLLSKYYKQKSNITIYDHISHKLFSSSTTAILFFSFIYYCGHLLAYYISPEWQIMIVEQLVEWMNDGETTVLGEKLSQCCSVHHTIPHELAWDWT
jgi:hypothetical protein